MNRIILRHYAGGEDTCEHVVKTRETIQTLLDQMGSKMERIGFHVITKEEPAPEEEGRKNLITLACPDLDFEETALEDVIGAETTLGDCTCGEGKCRAITIEGQSYQVVPPGLITDGILRIAFSAMETISGGGCESCCSDCNGCGI